VADETDYDGSDASDNYYASTAGCCDSPYLPAGDPEISASWPGGVYGEEGFGLTKLGYTSDSEQVHSLWPLIARR
jgi:hypothetical protein